MKTRVILIALLGFTALLQAQRQDDVWLFGYDYNNNPLSEGIRFTFGDSLVISYEQRPIQFMRTEASICDSSGQLILYTNGCYIENSNHGVVYNSEGLNPGVLYNLQCANGYGYGLSQNTIILQDLGNSDLYHLFHFPLVEGAQGDVYKNLLHTLEHVEEFNLASFPGD